MAKKKSVAVVGSKFRPSNADRYLNCPASVVMSKDIPLDGGTVYSETGTVAHMLGELCIEQGKDTNEFIGEKVIPEIDIPVDEEMARNVQLYVNWVKDQGFSDVKVEQMFAYPWVKNPNGEDTTGKADLVGYSSDFDALTVADYKNGVMPVADDSYQFGCYAYPLLFDEESPYKHLKEVTTIRHQPNVMEGTMVGTHVWSRADLIKLRHKVEFATEWVKKTKPSQVKDKDYCEGDHCKFCPNKHQCPLKVKALFDTAPPDKPLSPPSTLSQEKINLIIEKRAEIKKWLDDVYNFELSKSLRDEAPEGLKLVSGRNSARAYRKDLSVDVIADVLKKAGVTEVYQPNKLITPATVKKEIKKLDGIEDILAPASKPVVLVPESDKRSAIDGSDFFPAESDASNTGGNNA